MELSTIDSDDWAIVESFQEGKKFNQELCEDEIVTSSLYAVVDGSTDKSGLLYTWQEIDGSERQVSSGKFAALHTSKIIKGLTAGINPWEAVDIISESLNTEILLQYPDIKDINRPSCSIAVYDPQLNHIIKVGDCWHGYKTEDNSLTSLQHNIKIDSVLGTMRSLMLEALAKSGTPWNPASGNPDLGRELIMPFLKIQGIFANTLNEYGYGDINGQYVPEEYIEIFTLPEDVREIVLATDGYPEIIVDDSLSLTLAEENLAYLLIKDPLCISELKGNKGLLKDQLSYDDRSWLQLKRI
jgi:hypothetical protein